MSVVRLAVFVLVSFLIVSASIAGQQAVNGGSQVPQRDSLAISHLQKTIAALGGQQAISALQNSVATGALIPASTDTASEAGNFKWEDDFSAASYEFRYELNDGITTKLFASGHGTPAFGNGVKILSRSSHVAYASPPFHLPGIMLVRQLSNQNYSVRFIEATTVQGRPAIHIQTSIAGDAVETTLSPQDWFLDASTSLPIRVAYRVPSNGNLYSYKTDIADFSNYKVAGSVAIPFTMVTSEDNQVVCSAIISSISFNVGISPSDFDLTIGAAQ